MKRTDGFEVASAFLQIGHIAGDDLHYVQPLLDLINCIHACADPYVSSVRSLWFLFPQHTNMAGVSHWSYAWVIPFSASAEQTQVLG